MNRTHISLIVLSCVLLSIFPACSRTKKPVETAPSTPCPVQPTGVDAKTEATVSINHPKTPQEFEALLKKGKPVVLKVSATWCGPCRYMLPLFEKEANRYCNRALFVSIDADEKGMETIISRYASRGFPTFSFFDKNGVLIKDHPGSYPEAEFAAEIKAFVEKYS